MTKFDVSVFVSDCFKSFSSNIFSTRLKRMVATLASFATFFAFLTVLCLLVRSGSSSPDDDDELQRVHRSLLGVPPQSVVKRFSLAQSEAVAEVSRPNIVEQSDIFISVKTSKQFHEKRLDVILKTWFQLAKDETWFFTDDKDQDVDDRTSKSSDQFDITLYQ